MTHETRGRKLPRPETLIEPMTQITIGITTQQVSFLHHEQKRTGLRLGELIRRALDAFRMTEQQRGGRP